MELVTEMLDEEDYLNHDIGYLGPIAVMESSDNINHLPELGMTESTVTLLESIPEYIEGVNYEYSMASGNSQVTSHALGFSMNVGISPAELHGGMSDNTIIFRFNYKKLEGEYHGDLLGVKITIEFNFLNKRGNIKLE